MNQLPFLLPFGTALFLIRSITSTDWDDTTGRLVLPILRRALEILQDDGVRVLPDPDLITLDDDFGALVAHGAERDSELLHHRTSFRFFQRAAPAFLASTHRRLGDRIAARLEDEAVRRGQENHIVPDGLVSGDVGLDRLAGHDALAAQTARRARS
jgi:hypothetical protein